MVDSLWGDDFIVKPEPEVAKKVIKKIKEPKDPSKTVTRTVKSKSVSIHEKLALITENVKKILGVYAQNTQVICSRAELTNYIDSALFNGVIAVDTETDNSLVPLTCKLMGLCLYTPGQKNAYVPVNHVDVNTGVRFDWQVTEQEIFEELSRLTDKVIIITHNGKFDYQVIKCTTGYQMKVDWDTMVGAKILDENERSAGLKQQYIEKIDPSIEKYSIEHLFEGVEYALVKPEIFALYAATDSFMTYKLYMWQKEQFELKGHERLYRLFNEIEMPVVEVAAEMELAGVEIDKEYSKRLSAKYHKFLEDVDVKLQVELDKLEPTISKWRMSEEANIHPPKKTGDGYGKSKNEQLESPVNVASPTQLAILLYDILKVGEIDKKQPRGTGEPILEKIKLPICDLILERRGLVKLIDTYIDKFPEIVLPETGRLHAHFNQVGAGTGRFSSSDPNLQNIPSKNKEIRLMFKARDGYALVGSDFSAQEPRLLAHYSGDENMLKAYEQGQDLYAVIAQKVHNNDYWDNLEFRQDGSANPEGKKRRSEAKSILLGLMYGRGNASIAEQIGGTFEQAQEITDKFFNSFPKVKDWIEETQNSAKRLGYVEDVWGRRRRLPDIMLPKYTIKDTKASESTFNPLIGALGKVSAQSNPAIEKYRMLLESMKSRKEYEKIKSDAFKEGVLVVDNGGFIAQAERQCVNSRIQGGAATLTKIAMNKVHRDPILKNLGFTMLLAVHDELIGECPIENQDAVADRLCQVMIEAAKGDVVTPMKCDPTIEKSWYWTDYTEGIKKDYKKLLGKVSSDVALADMITTHTELTEETIREILSDIA